MYEGELTKGMVAKLRRGTKVSYVVSNGKQHMHTVQDEASKWIIENTDNLALVLRITTLWQIGINVFRKAVLELRAPDGTKLWPVEEKAPEEPVLTLAWLRERKACDEALKWLGQTVPHTHQGFTIRPETDELSWIAATAQWPLPAVIAALRKAKKWEWLNWLTEHSRDARNSYHRVLTFKPIAGDPCIQERKISTPDYPLNRVKELESELKNVRTLYELAKRDLDAYRDFNAWAQDYAGVHDLIGHGAGRRHVDNIREILLERDKELAELRQRNWKQIDQLREKLARRDRLEAGTAKNIRWFKAMAHHLLAGIDLQLERFGTPEARAKFEKEGREDLNDGDDMNGLGLGDIDWPEDD